jgi:Cu+-exporting ATPase
MAIYNRAVYLCRMATVQWKVEGMTCSHCALTINRFLENQGQNNVKVNPIDGDVSFETNDPSVKEKLIKGIEGLGYTVIEPEKKQENKKGAFLQSHLHRFLFCLPFTLILMLHMLSDWLPLHWLMNPWLQLALCLPVYFVGMSFFGKSAIKSLRNGIPNMNVLIALGATAAFVYSLTGTLVNWGPDYLFYETAATIITLVFLGNYMEDASVQSTQRALKKLVKSQKVMANMIAFDGDHQEVILPIENSQLKVGDLVLIRSGEQVPIDAKILWGDAHINESLLTGESVPVHKKAKDKIIGGSILESGSVKAQVTAVGEDTVLSGILHLIRKAQSEKPPVQQLADKISAVFVPVVIGLALITLVLNLVFTGSFTPALMRSIAVLVIACPCAMGLATPAAMAVGLGRAARSGILFRNATSLETFRTIQQVVFDKTGTLTTGEFIISGYYSTINDETFKAICWSLEKYSTHPIAKSIVTAFKSKHEIRWKQINEIRGQGMVATDMEGNEFKLGSWKIDEQLISDRTHNVYIIKNEELLGWVDVDDEIRPEAGEVLNYLHKKNINTILLSGDNLAKCTKVAEKLGIKKVIAEQDPAQKLQRIAELTAERPTAMVGDGINDAPALAKATLGISLSDASQLAMQNAQVILMNHGLQRLPLALGLGRHTYLTIKQNLFWAFFYNIVAIPIAALGYLTPGFSALVMGLSDVVLAINSVRLFIKKVV